MSEELVTMVRGKAAVLKGLLEKRGFLWSPKGYWTHSPALNSDSLDELASEIRRAGTVTELEVRNIRKEWA